MYRKYFKRLIDFLLSLIGIIIICPILIILAILIKLNSKGPILFKQKRLGEGGEAFFIYKFRTMVVNAENIGDGLKVKSESDSRITKVGKVLRKLSLDELPQLFNVIVGNMSLVGPRPPVTYHPYDGYENYPGWAKKRFEVKPGITGYAQVKVRNNASWDERIKYDNKYVNNVTLVNDLKILIETILVVFKSKDIYKS
ncbi:sugar transferase [Anaerococcus sp. AGMB00486]|uniref:Sugar transferase n=1 Tax=Anaerococcus faecalis TaxID=2742993 RepID=A0ABX2NAJ2_9FIRM|nr:MULTISPECIES: sugar transferase [Anaerococcus]MDY3007083.1 sugar transferase [Anaerococcus porci]NVF11532.1 sugar transferase [Anaerococcus faecalis]